jgi:hypothetical protein
LLSAVVPAYGAAFAIANAAAEKEAENQRQKALNSYIEEFTRKSVDFVTDMEMVIGATDENGELVNGLGSQVRAYMDNIAFYVDENDEFMRKQFAAQYETLDFIATLGDDSKDEETAKAFREQVLTNIDELTKLGTVTTQNIEALAKVFADLEEKKENYQEASKIIEDNDLINVAKDFGLSEDTSAEKLLSTALGTVNIDDNGNYSRHWSNKNEDNDYKFGSADGAIDPSNYSDAYLTNVVNDVLPKLQELGLGDVSFKAIQDYAKYSQNFDPEQMFADYTSTLLSTIQNSSGNVAADVYRAQANSEVQGYIDTSKALAAKAKEKMEQAQANNDYEAAKQARDEYNTYMQDVNTLEQQLLNVTRDMAGYMDSSQLNEFVTRINSTAEKLDNLRSSASGQEAFDTEQLDRLQNDIIPLLQKELGEGFDASAFVQDLQNGSVEGFKLLNQYEKLATEENRKNLQNNVDAHTEEIKRLEGNLKNASDSEKEAIQSQIKAEQAALAIAEVQLSNYEKNLDTVAGLTTEERKRLNIEKKLQALEEDESLEGLKKRIELTKELNKENAVRIDDKYEEILKGFGESTTMTKEMLKNIVKIENGAVLLGDAYEDLSDEEKQYIDSVIEGMEETIAAVEESKQQLKDLATSWYETQIDQQSQVLDAYKTQLESEQESLQNSLDKRKEMYEKYFDSLEEEESDETFEEEQARLQRAIAALSTSTDASSLQKLKEYQQELADLEDEQRATERERRRENVMDSMDNQSEALDQYYEDRLANEQALWEEIEAMSSEEISSLMTTYNEEFQNATDLNKEYMLLSYKQLQADIIAMNQGEDSAEAIAAREDANNYEEFIMAKGSGLVTDAYDDTLDYAALNQEDSYKRLYQEEKDALKADDEYYNETYEEWKKRKGYSQGGIVDYTGTAVVHGSPSKPEAFLNASQTALFGRLASNLEAFYTRTSAVAGGEDGGNNVVIENFTIAIDAELTDNNLNQTGQNLADALFEGLRRTGVSVNMKR